MTRSERLGLGIWIAIACVGFWATRHAPEPPVETTRDREIRSRQLAFVARDVERFDRERGDRVRSWEQAEGHLVIVIDDVGRELVAMERLQALRYRLTFSVLPRASYAMGAQLRLQDDPRRPRDVLLHLPMEPLGAEAMTSGHERDEVFLRVSDDDDALRAKTIDALQRVPAAIGVNNHMGSRLTTDARAIGVVVDELERRGLGFLDSRTTAETVAADVASPRVPTLSRAVFLDHDPDAEAMRASLVLAVERAKTEPTIAIGHPSDALAEVLERGLDEAWDQGVVVFPISEAWARSASM